MASAWAAEDGAAARGLGPVVVAARVRRGGAADSAGSREAVVVR
ncbi:hypothetical protein [Lentzea sp. E54]